MVPQKVSTHGILIKFSQHHSVLSYSICKGEVSSLTFLQSQHFAICCLYNFELFSGNVSKLGLGLKK